VPASHAHPRGMETGARLGTIDAPALHRTLAEHGGEVGELRRWPGVPMMCELSDPDGNTWVVVE
jgi:lactoylglutathione lyase